MKDEELSVILDSGISYATAIKKECELLVEMVDFIGDSERISARISAVENDADDVAHQLAYFYRENKLNEDSVAMNIYSVYQSMEGCTDALEELAKTIVRYNVTDVNDVLVHSVAMMNQAADKIMTLCLSFNKNEHDSKIIKTIMEIDKYKIDYLKVYDKVIRKLFTDDLDPIEVMRWKEVYTSIKDVFESIEDISDSAFHCIVVEKY